MVVSTTIFCIILLISAKSADSEEPYVVYANGASSERNIPICLSPRTACNLVQKRFWLSPMVKRLCKCPDRSECPSKWEDSDKFSMTLNSRSQLKFCGQVGNLPNCSSREIAMVTESNIDTLGRLNQAAEVHCYCPKNHYFERVFSDASIDNEGNIIRKEFHICTEFQYCSRGEFCGFITTTSYETYHTCLCPYKNICMMESRKHYHVLQPLYKGTAFRGVCTTY